MLSLFYYMHGWKEEGDNYKKKKKTWHAPLNAAENVT